MTRISRLTPLALAAVCAITLVGCSPKPDQASVETTAPASQSTPSATAEPTPSATPSPSSAATSGAAATDDLGAVVSTAESAVTDSRAWGLDWEEDTSEWEVTVVAGDRSIEVRVSADGSEALGQRDDDRVDAEDRAEMDAATVEMLDAVATARAEVPGAVDGVSLDEENGVPHWEVDIREGDQLRTVDVVINATTGDILRVER